MSSLVRRSPSREAEQLFDRFQRFFQEASLLPAGLGFGREAMSFADWTPVVDIQETPDAYVLTAELPDVKREDVRVTIDNGVLVLAGERRQEKEEKNRRFHRMERSFGRFERSFSLPEAIDEQKVGAAFRDGVLHVTLPKAASKKSPKHEIPIG